MDHLTKKQENFCETAGIFGVLIAATCLVQHVIFMIPDWITYSMIIVYLLAIVAFFMLARRSAYAYLLIIISTILIFLLEAFMLLVLVFSLVLLILLVYSILMLVFLQVYGIQNQLKLKAVAERAEKEKWDNIYR